MRECALKCEYNVIRTLRREGILCSIWVWGRGVHDFEAVLCSRTIQLSSIYSYARLMEECTESEHCLFSACQGYRSCSEDTAISKKQKMVLTLKTNPHALTLTPTQSPVGYLSELQVCACGPFYKIRPKQLAAVHWHDICSISHLFTTKMTSCLKERECF